MEVGSRELELAPTEVKGRAESAVTSTVAERNSRRQKSGVASMKKSTEIP